MKCLTGAAAPPHTAHCCHVILCRAGAPGAAPFEAAGPGRRALPGLGARAGGGGVGARRPGSSGATTTPAATTATCPRPLALLNHLGSRDVLPAPRSTATVDSRWPELNSCKDQDVG